jgi:hypothetical protein
MHFLLLGHIAGSTYCEDGWCRKLRQSALANLRNPSRATFRHRPGLQRDLLLRALSFAKLGNSTITGAQAVERHGVRILFWDSPMLLIMLLRRTIRSNALEKIARLSAQSTSSATTTSDFQRLFKRCPNASEAYVGSKAEEYGVSRTRSPMVRRSRSVIGTEGHLEVAIDTQ